MADAAGLWVVVGALAAGVPQLLTAAVQSVSVRGQRKHDAAQAQVQRDADAADREAQRKHDAAQAQHANNPTAVLWPRRLHGNHAVKPPLDWTAPLDLNGFAVQDHSPRLGGGRVTG